MTRSAIEIIRNYNQGRIPEVLEIKYKIMSENAFRFFRGTCHLFYHDLFKTGPIFPDKTRVWLCGDLHMENFGVYKGDNDLIYFDINDFDESTLGHCTYDLSRFITSLFLSSKVLGLNEADIRNLSNHFLNRFSTYLMKGKAKVIERPCANGIILSYFKQIESRTKKSFLKNWTEKKGNLLRLKKSNPHILPLNEALKKEVMTVVQEFLEKKKAYALTEKDSKNLITTSKINSKDKTKPLSIPAIHLFDVGFRLAGTGSMGLDRYLILAEIDRKIHMIDMKESQKSSLEVLQKTEAVWPYEGERIVAIQEMMQGTSPGLLGVGFMKKNNYIIRELQPEEDKLNFLEIKFNKAKIQEVINEMALLTASAYLRSSGWKTSSTKDELKFFAEQTTWKKAIIDYSYKYSLQVNKDFESFKKAFKEGKMKS